MVHWRELWKSECRAELPTYRILVPGSVPQTVIDTWKARGYATNSSSSKGLTFANQTQVFSARMNHNVIRSKFVFATATGAGVATTGVFGLAELLSLTTRADSLISTTVGGLTLVSALATGAVGAITGRKFMRDPKRLTKKGLERAPYARWITPQSLGYRAGTPGLDTDEQRLFHLAVVIARTIAGTRAWTHPTLEGHVSRVDLDFAVASIGERLRELYELRSELDSIREPNLNKRIDVYQANLARAFASIARRVESMFDYLEQLRKLSVQLVQLENAEASRALGDRVLDVVSRTAGDDYADAQFKDFNLEAESHADAITAMLNELDESVEEFEHFDELDRKLAQADRERHRLE